MSQFSPCIYLAIKHQVPTMCRTVSCSGGVGERLDPELDSITPIEPYS